MLWACPSILDVCASTHSLFPVSAEVTAVGGSGWNAYPPVLQGRVFCSCANGSDVWASRNSPVERKRTHTSWTSKRHSFHRQQIASEGPMTSKMVCVIPTAPLQYTTIVEVVRIILLSDHLRLSAYAVHTCTLGYGHSLTLSIYLLILV